METVPYEDIRSEYAAVNRRKILFTILCAISAFIALGFSFSFGKYSVGFLESYEVIIDHILGRAPVDEMKDFIVWDLRLPRAVMALAAGAGLAVGGAAMQSMMRNPLADPYTIGVSSGASLGATLSIVLGLSVLPFLDPQTSVVVNAFVFSLIPVAVILLVTRYRRTTPTMMILSGIAVMYIFSATTQLIMLTADPDALAEAYEWNVGTLGKADWDNIWIVIAASAFGTAFLCFMSKDLNIVTSGDRCAKSFGVDSNRVRIVCMIVISIVTATIVSFTGTIGFVGLISPHVVRIFLGSDNRFLIPASAAFGALLLMLADCAAKVAGPTGLPVGVITALIGGPLFLLLLIRMRRNVWK